jgi:hypothetical protein
MNWQYLKDKIYFSDGSLRDIYVLNTSKLDWQKWIDFVNENYEINFTYSDRNGNLKQSDRILTKYVFDFWDGISEFLVNAKVIVGDIIVKCYFFTEEEIENDITPNEIKSVDQHNQIVDYMKSISRILDKEIILTTENYNCDYNKLIVINNDYILIN